MEHCKDNAAMPKVSFAYVAIGRRIEKMDVSAEISDEDIRVGKFLKLLTPTRYPLALFDRVAGSELIKIMGQ